MKQTLSSQDVRNKVIRLRDSLINNLEFLQAAIDDDLEFLKLYRGKYGDLNYRPIIARDVDGRPTYGERTEILLEPIASKYRATIKSLLDSIRLIESEILPEDNPEGETTTADSTSSSASSAPAPGERRASLRKAFQTQAPTPEPQLPPTELVENDPMPPESPISPVTESKPTPEPKTIPSTWKPKPQRVLVENHNTDEPALPKPNPLAKQAVETPLSRLRKGEGMGDEASKRLAAELLSLRGGGGKPGGSKLKDLMAKYGSEGSDEDEE